MKKFFKTLFIFIISVIIITSGILFSAGYSKFRSAITQAPLEDAIYNLKEENNYTYYEDVPQIYFDALVAVEDRRFYKHGGFDIIGTARAIINSLKAKEMVEGGSTISQQLAKNLYFPQDDTLTRKIAEIFMAVTMEKSYSKEEILEFYVNAIYYGSGYYNIYDASIGYFNKSPSQMTPYECTLLVGVPNAPSVYSPDVNPDLAKKRQEKVIDCLVECGYIEDESEILS